MKPAAPVTRTVSFDAISDRLPLDARRTASSLSVPSTAIGQLSPDESRPCGQDIWNVLEVLATSPPKHCWAERLRLFMNAAPDAWKRNDVRNRWICLAKWRRGGFASLACFGHESRPCAP